MRNNLIKAPGEPGNAWIVACRLLSLRPILRTRLRSASASVASSKMDTMKLCRILKTALKHWQSSDLRRGTALPTLELLAWPTATDSI